jgi:hypothetical protein
LGTISCYNVYAAINAARAFSPALRSSNRWFIDGNGFTITNSTVLPNTRTPMPRLATQDVVFAFANVDRAQ